MEHVLFLRNALGGDAVAKPAINLDALGIGFCKLQIVPAVGARLRRYWRLRLWRRGSVDNQQGVSGRSGANCSHRSVRDPNGVDHALVFAAKVEDLEITGCDFLRYDADGKIVDFMVMVRPLRAAEALSRQMAARFEQIQADAIAAAANAR